MKKIGRPTKYTPELGKEICSRIASGRSLARICKEDDDMPGTTAIFSWLFKDEQFAKDYARAQEMRAETLLDEIADIADTPSRENGSQTDPTGAAHRRLQIDTRKWVVVKLFPRKYGDKLQTEHTGGVDIKQIKRVIVEAPRNKEIDITPPPLELDKPKD